MEQAKVNIPVSAHFVFDDRDMCESEFVYASVAPSVLADLLIRGFGLDVELETCE